MAALIFDSHAFVKKLRDAGFSEEQAECLVAAHQEVFSQLVTKDDLQVELRLLEQRIVIKLGALSVAAVGAVAALIKIL
jgi:hypothetical protein